MRFRDIEVHFQYTRMTIDVFDELLAKVGPRIEKLPTHYREPISSRDRLYMTLRYLATGDNMSSIAYAFRVGRSTVSSIVKETCEALWNTLQDELFQPSEDGWKAVAKEFERLWNFPHCIGALDGKHIIIQAPPNSGSAFYDYKGHHSIHLMAIASATYRFLLVDIGAEGRHSDGGVFTNSLMGRRFRNNEMNVPPSSPIITDGEPMSYILVADEAFQLSNFILRPYPGKTLTNEQRVFNYRLSRARRVIENSFGIMVARWRIFTKPICTSLMTADKIVQACVVLHNFLMDKPNYCEKGFADEIHENQIIPGSWRNELQNYSALNSHGSAGSNTHSRIAALGRENYKNYFLNEGAVSWQWTLYDGW